MISDECEDRNKPTHASPALKINSMFYLLILTRQKISAAEAASSLLIQRRCRAGAEAQRFLLSYVGYGEKTEVAI